MITISSQETYLHITYLTYLPYLHVKVRRNLPQKVIFIFSNFQRPDHIPNKDIITCIYYHFKMIKILKYICICKYVSISAI